jgi:hypothetical protein
MTGHFIGFYLKIKSMIYIFYIYILIGFNSSSIIEGKTLTGFPSNILYQTLYISVIIGNCLVENQYCVGFLSVNSGFGQGVGSVAVEIDEYATNFKCLR